MQSPKRVAVFGAGIAGLTVAHEMARRGYLVTVYEPNAESGGYHWKHEPCLYGWKSGAAHGWYSDRCQTTVLEFDRPSRSTEHPTMKAVALFAYQIRNSTAPHGLVLDTFLGSGTTLIAAEQLGRKCYGLELSPHYCEIIASRYQTFTGKPAILERTGDSPISMAERAEVVK